MHSWEIYLDSQTQKCRKNFEKLFFQPGELYVFSVAHCFQRPRVGTGAAALSPNFIQGHGHLVLVHFGDHGYHNVDWYYYQMSPHFLRVLEEIEIVESTGQVFPRAQATFCTSCGEARGQAPMVEPLSWVALFLRRHAGHEQTFKRQEDGPAEKSQSKTQGSEKMGAKPPRWNQGPFTPAGGKL